MRVNDPCLNANLEQALYPVPRGGVRRSITQAVIWERESSPSLRRSLATWLATVCSEIESSVAIWRLVRPRATNAATCCSRRVRGGLRVLMDRVSCARAVMSAGRTIESGDLRVDCPIALSRGGVSSVTYRLLPSRLLSLGPRDHSSSLVEDTRVPGSEGSVDFPFNVPEMSQGRMSRPSRASPTPWSSRRLNAILTRAPQRKRPLVLEAVTINRPSPDKATALPLRLCGLTQQSASFPHPTQKGCATSLLPQHDRKATSPMGGAIGRIRTNQFGIRDLKGAVGEEDEIPPVAQV